MGGQEYEGPQKAKAKTKQGENRRHTFRTVVDTQPGKGLDVREGGVVQVTPGRDAHAQRVVDHNRHWTLVDRVGVDG